MQKPRPMDQLGGTPTRGHLTIVIGRTCRGGRGVTEGPGGPPLCPERPTLLRHSQGDPSHSPAQGMGGSTLVPARPPLALRADPRPSTQNLTMLTIRLYGVSGRFLNTGS